MSSAQIEKPIEPPRTAVIFEFGGCPAAPMENVMAYRWKKWWAAGLALSCGCALEPMNADLPNKRLESWGLTPDGEKKVIPASFNSQSRNESPDQSTPNQPPPKKASEDLPTAAATGLQVPELKPLPINLATALRLMNARAWDINIAAEGVRAASAQLLAANVLWIPSLVGGVDYQHHDGPIQASDGSISSSSHSNLSVGAAPTAVFSVSDAIFEPLAVRQIERARRQQLQAATNDTTLSVAQAYFNVQQARGNLAGAQDTIRRTNEMLRRIEALAPDLVPQFEVARARAQLSQFEQNLETARENWNVSSAELVRILRMSPATVVEPAEPPHMQITLISPDEPIERLLSLALMTRPELGATQNLAQAAMQRWREERYRPFVPNFYLRGNSTQLPDSLAFTGYGGGQGGTIGRLGLRDDFELQAMWELRNLGFGNAALIKGRRADMEATRMQAYRAQDLVAREVVAALAQVRSAAARVKHSERELKAAVLSAEANYTGLGETKRIGGNLVLPIIRPQEALASVQALLQAYYDYYGTVADYNRAEFGLYRALGNPAQALLDPTGALSANGINCAVGQESPPLGPTTSTPPQPGMPTPLPAPSPAPLSVPMQVPSAPQPKATPPATPPTPPPQLQATPPATPPAPTPPMPQALAPAGRPAPTPPGGAETILPASAIEVIPVWRSVPSQNH